MCGTSSLYPNTQVLRHKDHEKLRTEWATYTFWASFGYTARPCLKIREAEEKERKMGGSKGKREGGRKDIILIIVLEIPAYG